MPDLSNLKYQMQLRMFIATQPWISVDDDGVLCLEHFTYLPAA